MELTSEQSAVLSETANRLKHLLLVAEHGMESSAVAYINHNLLDSQPGGNGTWIATATTTMRGSCFEACFQDCIKAVLNLSERQSPRMFGGGGLSPGLQKPERWQKSVGVLKAALATMQPASPDLPAGCSGFASATATIPDEYRDNTNAAIGPLTGAGAALARAITCRDKATKDDLQKKHANKVVFVRKIGDREFEAYFTDNAAFIAAKNHMDGEKRATANEV